MDKPDPQANWKRMRFKRNKVWVAVDEQERPIVEKAKVLIKYQLEQKHQYWVRQQSVLPLEAPHHVDNSESASEHRPAAADIETPGTIDPEKLKKAIRIYTDGACSGNPGPAGIGVVMQYRQHQKEISRHIGTATNNIAELEAIRAGLLAVKNRDHPVVVFTDSSYALGLLSKSWKPRQNRELVQTIRALIGRFKDFQIVKVRGHAGHPENERADRLAVRAIRRGRGGA